MDTIKRKGLDGKMGDADLRSLYWKVYLDYLPSLTPDAWPLILAKERSGYADLKKKFMFDPNRQMEANDWTLNNPLSLAEEVGDSVSVVSSPWTQYFKDTELQKIIRQDVERTFPDQPIFRTPAVQNTMTEILFVWCKLNPDVSYRQGMHELLGPIMLVVERDKLDSRDGTGGLPEALAATFDPKFVEHDSAVLFYRLMRAAKPWFEVAPEMPVSKPVRNVRGSKFEEHRGSSTTVKPIPVVAICRKIHHDMLRVLDFELYQHLEKHGVEPQLYGLRWLRLLFGREFPMPELFTLWDGIFAEDSSLSLVEWVCVTMLIFLRGKLIGSDYSMTMHGLMKFPPMESLGTTVSQFISSARGLRLKYNQKAFVFASNSNRSPAPASALAPGQPIESPAARLTPKKRSTVPWNHSIAQASPSITTPSSPTPSGGYPPAGTPSRRSESSWRSSSPPASPRGSSPSVTPPSTSPIPLVPEASKQSQTQLAMLTRQVQQFRERDRALSKKMDRCVGILADVVKGAAPGVELQARVAELEGVVDELRAVAAELLEIHPGKGERSAPVSPGRSNAPSPSAGPAVGPGTALGPASPTHVSPKGATRAPGPPSPIVTVASALAVMDVPVKSPTSIAASPSSARPLPSASATIDAPAVTSPRTTTTTLASALALMEPSAPEPPQAAAATTVTAAIAAIEPAATVVEAPSASAAFSRRPPSPPLVRAPSKQSLAPSASASDPAPFRRAGRMGSSPDIRNASPSASRTDSKSRSRSRSASPERSATNGPRIRVADPWATTGEAAEAVVGTVRSGIKVFMGLFEDPWAEHGPPAGLLSAGVERMGSSADIRTGAGTLPDREMGAVPSGRVLPHSENEFSGFESGGFRSNRFADDGGFDGGIGGDGFDGGFEATFGTGGFHGAPADLEDAPAAGFEDVFNAGFNIVASPYVPSEPAREPSSLERPAPVATPLHDDPTLALSPAQPLPTSSTATSPPARRVAPPPKIGPLAKDPLGAGRAVTGLGPVTPSRNQVNFDPLK
ncbi:hypothetical protein BDK51DRAFT_32771 [Blyttiomyces helicus]|uniref:Rab-GAP TBC domain-containing protein n=1 Tax=Blyttiomyces helicus TaxID=388810 RepID=A0A4P9WP28_9FUNG|nr:hypothetical protein BDK51DRAFT_32771 [Blyttiomyces helicus]|eukprot:RKO94055.1 hypothetical protein BDK51DRAFT_32771 [Blyttiomyces helicus]